MFTNIYLYISAIYFKCTDIYLGFKGDLLSFHNVVHEREQNYLLTFQNIQLKKKSKHV